MLIDKTTQQTKAEFFVNYNGIDQFKFNDAIIQIPGWLKDLLKCQLKHENKIFWIKTIREMYRDHLGTAIGLYHAKEIVEHYFANP